MHVLVVPWIYSSDLYPHLGANVRLFNRGLKAQGVKVGVAFSEAVSPRTFRPALLRRCNLKPLQSEDESGIIEMRNRFISPPGRRLQHPVVKVGFTHCMQAYIDRHGRPDLIHAHGQISAGVAAAQFARAQGIPLVLTEHFSLFLRGAPLADWLSRELAKGSAGVDHWISVSRALRDALCSFSYGLEERPHSVIPNCIDTDFYSLASGDAARREARDEIIAVGSLVQVKRFDLLIRAFARAFPQQSGPKLVLVGRGALRESLAALSQSLGVASRVEFTGFLDASQLLERYRNAKFLVSSSDAETHGMAIVEGLACGLAVVSTRSGGPQETIRPGRDGFLVPTGDVGALADAMGELHRGIGAFKPAEIHRSVVERFGIESVAKRLLAVYEQVLGARRNLGAQRGSIKKADSKRAGSLP